MLSQMVIDILENIDMFSRAWRQVVIPKYGIDVCSEFTVEQAGEVWREEFGIVSIIDKYNRFRYAEFTNEREASWFLLRWS